MRLRNIRIAVNDIDRAIRFFDPDRILIEVGIPMN